MRAASTPPGTLKIAKAMKTKNGISVAMKAESWNLVLTASDKGPMASATPIRRNAMKIGKVLILIRVDKQWVGWFFSWFCRLAW